MSFSPTWVALMLGIPPFFKEIFKHLPNALLDLISWREMLAEVTVLSNRLLTNKGADEVLQNIQKLLPAGVQTTKELPEGKLTITQGEKILELYFSQIMKGEKIFLDFRPKHFAAKNESLEWNPGGLWAEFEPDFKEGLKMIYEGYYSGDDELFAKGMEKCGLSNKPQVLEVFKKHFGNGRDEKTAFNIEVFKESFAQIFKTLVENKIELDKNFLYLGIMLVTLYITLNQIGGAYDVSGIFKRSH